MVLWALLWQGLRLRAQQGRVLYVIRFRYCCAQCTSSLADPERITVRPAQNLRLRQFEQGEQGEQGQGNQEIEWVLHKGCTQPDSAVELPSPAQQVGV